MTGKKLSRTGLYIVIFCSVLLITNASLGMVLTVQSSESLTSMIHDRMLDISNTAAAMIDGDALSRIEADDTDSPEYKEILDILLYFRDNIDLKYIYCIRDMGNKNFVFTIDPAVDDPGLFGEPIVYTDALYSASLGVPSVDSKPYEDRWGSFYSAYSPVFDSKGNVSGIVAVDFSAEWYAAKMKNFFKTIVFVSFFFLLLGAVVVFVMAYRFRKRFRVMCKELDSLTDGIETLAEELTSESVLEGGTELFKEIAGDQKSFDSDIMEMSNRLSMLREYMTRQIGFVRAKAYKDGLTGLDNRTAYMEHIHYIDQMIENGTASFGVAMFDINGLKNINDELGHEIGDKVIIKTARILTSVFEGMKTYRIGGDEFVVDLDCSEEEIIRLMKKFDDMISSQISNDETPEIAISKGYAIYSFGRDRSHQDVFSRADNEMYSDKKKYYLEHADRRRSY